MADVTAISRPAFVPSERPAVEASLAKAESALQGEQAGAKGLDLLGAATETAAKTSLSLQGISSDPTNFNVLIGTWNTIEAGLTRCAVLGGGTDINANRIGSVLKPNGTAAPDPTTPYWGTGDPGYVPGSAGVAVTCGGYDIVNNQIAGFMGGGGHNWNKYNAIGHSVTVGGSFQLNCGARSFLGGGQYGVIGPAANFSAIVCSSNSEITGNYSFIGVAVDSQISGACSSIPCGINLKMTSNFGLMFGRDGISKGDYVLTVARQKLISDGDNQTHFGGGGLLTANATETSLVLLNAIGETGLRETVRCTVSVTATSTSDGKASVYEKQCLYQTISPTSARLVDLDSKSSITSTGPSFSMNMVLDEIGIAAAPPKVRLTVGTGGRFVVRCSGLAATQILWNSEIRVGQTLYRTP